MSGLSDSYLDDLDDLGDSDEEGGGVEQPVQKARATTVAGAVAEESGDEGDSDDSDNDEINQGDEVDDLDKMLVDMVAAKAASSVGQLRKSARYKKHLSDVAAAKDAEFILTSGTLEDDPDYKLILTSNKLIQDIDEEIIGTQRYVTQIYSKKFPELESLIPNKIDYIRTVQRIGNEMDMTMVDLGDIISSASVMIVSVAGSTTSGQRLSDSELSECFKGCEEVLQLDNDKALILAFVESRMSKIAPNVSYLVGSRVAAQLVGLAGGLIALSKIPACNIQVMGQEKRILGGLSQIAAMPHIGVLHYSELVQRCQPSLRRKALKVVAGKASLAARVDSYRSHTNGSEGLRLRKEIDDKIDKWQEPPKAKTKKALPIPEEKKKSRRGGKRVRKMKERYAITEMRSMQNKIKFTTDEGEYGDSAMGMDRGMLDSKESGKIRAPKFKETKLLSKKQKTAVTSLSSGQTNGLSSSLVFTPVQGLELVNPNAAADRVKAANAKWFNSNSGFLSAAPPK